MKNTARHIAIIGGGFSGTMALVNLVEKARAPLTISLIEKTGQFARGVAYGTWDANHLLNVPAHKMGAFAEDEAHFWHWLNDPAHTARWRPTFPSLTLDAEAFMPRALYRIYLESLLEEALQKAKTKSIQVNLIEGEALDASPSGGRSQLHYKYTDARAPQTLLADSLILATGNPPPRSFRVTGDSAGRFAQDVWNPPESNILRRESLADLPKETHVLIIGTGLTMVDIILSLASRGFPGTITALSRHGHLPCPHAPGGDYHAPDWLSEFARIPQTAAALFHLVRRHVRAARKNGHAWQDVISSLRPVTNPLWSRLSTSAQRRLLRKAMPFWNIHRHRMPLSSAEALETLQRTGKLRLLAGHIQDIAAAPEALTVTYRARAATMQARVTAILNCAGPEMNIERSGNPLLLSLLKQKLITPGRLGMGLELAENGSAHGSDGRIFPLGPLRLGADIESIAVPELRAQAAEAALSSQEFHNY